MSQYPRPVTDRLSDYSTPSAAAALAARPAPRNDPTRSVAAQPTVVTSRPLSQPTRHANSPTRSLPHTPSLATIMTGGRVPLGNIVVPVVVPSEPRPYSNNDSPLHGPPGEGTFTYTPPASSRGQQQPLPVNRVISHEIYTPERSPPPSNRSYSTYSAASAVPPPVNAAQIQAIANTTATMLSRSNTISKTVAATPSVAVAAPPPPPPLPKAVRVGSSEITEESLMRDVLWVCLGTDRGTHVEWSPHDQHYRMLGPCPTVRYVSMLKQWQPCGVLFRKLTMILKGSDTGVVTSLMQQSLYAAMDRQLNKYREVIAAEMKQPHLAPDRLQRMHHTLFVRLSKMFNVAGMCREKKGGVLLARIAECLGGGEEVTALLNDMVAAALHPFFAMLRIWITQGDLQDPFNEFLVEHDAAVRDGSEQYWAQKYKLNKPMLPPERTTATKTIFSPKLVEDILAIGKTINFVRVLCQQSDSCVSKALVKRVMATPVDADWAGVVSSVLGDVNAVLHNTLTKTCNLRQHFYVLNYFVLLAKGDFVQQLFGKALPVLAGVRDILTQSKLRECLSGALRETLTNDVDPLLTDRLHIVCDVDSGKKGTTDKLFAIAYQPQGIMNNIFDQGTLGMYMTMCKYLVKVKHSEWILKEAWREGAEVDRECSRMPRSTPMRSLAADTHQLWLECQHFVQILQSYLVHEALSNAWRTFSEKMETTSCLSLDEIRRIHNEFLNEVMVHSLQSGREDLEIPRKIIEETLTTVHAFCMLHQRVYQLVVKKRGEESVIGPQLKRLATQFRTCVGRLLLTLEKGALTQYDFLNSLVQGLNFNGFYSNVKGGMVAESE